MTSQGELARSAQFGGRSEAHSTAAPSAERSVERDRSSIVVCRCGVWRNIGDIDVRKSVARQRKRHVQQELRFANAAGNLRGGGLGTTSQAPKAAGRCRRHRQAAHRATAEGLAFERAAREAARDQGQRACARHAAHRRRHRAPGASHARHLQSRARSDARDVSTAITRRSSGHPSRRGTHSGTSSTTGASTASIARTSRARG
jgi:hypothetical protein